MASIKALEKKLAKLEFANDQLLTELAYIDRLMHHVGFSGGLASLKATANELYEMEASELLDDNEYDDNDQEEDAI